ncbi:helix-turn-helix domain-containing protein [uncultured Rikenella sp.]|uniref:helix-turn-helix domain-containing protein n=1 Tax=uncultured Rikenella sp. TaxID=368003 RepID=UPI00261E51BD|nr:helix-turn-helix domain-containing protein [uncultured Rikenella sp.]
MTHNDSEQVLLPKNFIAGTYTLTHTTNRLWKPKGGAVFICRQGTARMNIDLKDYEIVPKTVVMLLPGSIFRIDRISEDCTISVFGFPNVMFHEASFRINLGVFGYLKEYPCNTLPDENETVLENIIQTASTLFADTQNRYRAQIAKNLLRCLLLEIYDKSYRFAGRQQIEGGNRQEELLRKFMTLVHEYISSEREVAFYAGKLCISTKYLTSVCRRVSGASAKMIIDKFAVLEIKVLLQSTELTIQEISDRLRFPDQSYMGRYFKRHEGVSPKEYRAGLYQKE